MAGSDGGHNLSGSRLFNMPKAIRPTKRTSEDEHYGDSDNIHSDSSGLTLDRSLHTHAVRVSLFRVDEQSVVGRGVSTGLAGSKPLSYPRQKWELCSRNT